MVSFAKDQDSMAVSPVLEGFCNSFGIVKLFNKLDDFYAVQL